MPTFLGKPFSSYFKNLLGINQSSNTGVDSTTRVVHDGAGQSTSISLSDDVLSVQPVTDNTTGTMLVKNQGGSNILAVDTDNSKVLMGASQVPPTLFKEMGLYDFSPLTTGYHYPLVANTMFIPTGAESFAGDDDWGNDTDPATTLDVSGLTQQENAVAVYWYLENDITLDSVRFIATTDDASDYLKFHLFSYTLNTTSNPGDLSGGVVHANGSVAATSTSIKTSTLTLDEADIDASKVVIGFVENSTSTADLTVSFNIKYHIR
tara:strand:- start:1109 stop:1900 length:792 start_codon:yes stop_codon:yes gene_type:complete